MAEETVAKTSAGNNIEDIKDSKGNVIAADVEVTYMDHASFAPSDALAAQISSGAVKTETKLVSFPVKSDGKIVKVFRQSYTSCSLTPAVYEGTGENRRLVDAKGHNIGTALALPAIDGDESRLYELVSSKADQTRFQGVYVALKNAAENTPEKATDKLKKLLDGMPEDVRKEALKNLGLS